MVMYRCKGSKNYFDVLLDQIGHYSAENTLEVIIIMNVSITEYHNCCTSMNAQNECYT